MFLICGEALFDVFAAGGESGSLRFDAIPGGSPFNVALGIARMDQRSALLTGLSDDFLGEHLRTLLQASGVSTDYLVRIQAPTTLSLVTRRNDGAAEYAFYGNGAADRLLQINRIPPLSDDIRCIHIGSYATVVEPTAAALEQLVRRERQSRFISYDPNVRLNVHGSRADWVNKVELLASLSHLVKLSEEDVRQLYGVADAEILAQRWLDKGCSLVVLTRDKEGLRAWNRHGHVEVASLPVPDLIDTVGAGDTVQAAVLSQLAERGKLDPEAASALSLEEVRQILEFSVAAAAITCSRRGADLPRRYEVLRRLESQQPLK